MIRIFFFLTGFALMVIGFVFIILYLNLLTIGYNFLQYVNFCNVLAYIFIFSVFGVRISCIFSLIHGGTDQQPSAKRRKAVMKSLCGKFSVFFISGGSNRLLLSLIVRGSYPAALKGRRQRRQPEAQEKACTIRHAYECEVNQ